MTGEVVEKKTRRKKVVADVGATDVTPKDNDVRGSRRSDGSYIVKSTHNLIVISR